jgi:outer membrane protein assembly factor BamE (lipoprotein component of BamABCDE complex)
MRLTSILFCCLILCACGTTHEIGTELNVAAASQIKPGVTDKAAVERTLGVPTARKVAATGEEIWLYVYERSSGGKTPIGYIPIVGGYLPHAFARSNISQEVEVHFKDNIVSRCSVLTTTKTMSGNSLGTTTTPSVVDADCREPSKGGAQEAERALNR